ncbi:MAG: YigZ family protein [Candidatus Zixiibacteriota bacterium]
MLPDDDLYYTINKQAQAETKVKGSRFIARAFLVANHDETQARLTEIRKQEHSATHNCFAWRLGLGENITFKYSDDGEPSGTAGKPIYDLVEGNKLTNILVVVTRYFGGTKLGTGGLVRAYSDATRQALHAAGRRENFVMTRLNIEIEFSFYDQLVKLINRHKASIVESLFSDRVKLSVDIRKSKSKQIRSAIVELTGNRVEIETIS